MRFHTSLTRGQMHDAVVALHTAGLVARSVWPEFTGHRSSIRARAFAVRLSSHSRVPGDGRRQANSGWGGAAEGYSATYDEWGRVLRAWFTLDPHAVVGNPGSPIYDGLDLFDFRTGDTYRPDLAARIEAHGDPYPYRSGRSQVGRRGYGRCDGDTFANGHRVPQYILEAADRGDRGAFLKLDPRTPEWARAFAAGEAK